MLKALLDGVLELAAIKPQIEKIGENSYCKYGLKRIKKPEQTPPEILIFNNLDGLAKYVERVSNIHAEATTLPHDGL